MTLTLDDLYAAFANRPKPASVPFGPIPVRSGEGTRYAQTALSDEANRVATAPEGTRNDTLNRAAFSISQLVNAGHLEPQAAWDALHDAARRAGLPDHEIENTLQSGYTGAQRKPRTNVPDPQESDTWLPDDANPATTLPAPSAIPSSAASSAGSGDTSGLSSETDAPSATGAEPSEPTVTELVHKHLPAIDWHELWADEDEEEWIIEPILPARRLVALYSAPKVGKSLLMLELAVATAMGSEALGAKIDRPRRVLYVDFENDPKADVRERLKAMGYGPDDLGNLYYLSFPTLGGLDSEQGAAELMAAVQAYECEVVVIDTVSRSITGDENENDTWLAFYRHTGLAMKQAGIAMIRLDHAGKDESKVQRGGSAKVGDVDAVWRMSKITDEVFQLECEANRMPVMEKVLVLNRDTTPLRHQVKGDGLRSAWEAKVDQAMKVLEMEQIPLDMGVHKAWDQVKRFGVARDPLREAIRQRRQQAGIATLDDPD